MLAYTYVEQGKFALLDKPKPVLQNDRDAIVRVTLASICTSDLHIKHGSVPQAAPGITVGHEMVGVVEEVGAAVTTVRPGDRVTVNVETFCGQCFFCKHGWVNNCTDSQRRLGTGLPHRRGPGGICPGTLRRSGPEQNSRWRSATGRPCLWATSWPLAFGQRRISEIHPEDTVLIIGAGPTGICTLLCALLQSPKRIIVCEKDPQRLRLCAGALPPGA